MGRPDFRAVFVIQRGFTWSKTKEVMSVLFRIAEKLITGENPERKMVLTPRQRRAHIRRQIKEIEKEKTQGYIYGEAEDLKELIKHFTGCGYAVETLMPICIRIKWQ